MIIKIVWSILILSINFSACSKKNDAVARTNLPDIRNLDIRNLEGWQRLIIFQATNNPNYELYSDEYREECLHANWDDRMFLSSIVFGASDDLKCRITKRIKELWDIETA
jgi:hypothetical protein